MKAARTILVLVLLQSKTAATLLKGTKRAREQSIEAKNDPTTMDSANSVRRTSAPEGDRGPSPEELCSAFMIYDFLTRKMERARPPGDGVNIDWSSACPVLQDLNPQLCPSGRYLEDICTEPYKVDLNPSVSYDYCQPLLAEIEDEKDFFHCVRACIRYVSRDRGDCCQFECL